MRCEHFVSLIYQNKKQTKNPPDAIGSVLIYIVFYKGKFQRVQ